MNLDTLTIPAPSDDTEWADRSAHWIEHARTGTKPRGRRERNREALVLSGNGASLKVDRGTLVIRDGFTHYPQNQAVYRYFRGDKALPSRIMLLDGSGSISFDVLSWLSAQGVPLIRVTWDGQIASVLGGAGFSADLEKVRWQSETRSDAKQRLEFCTDLVMRKVKNSAATLSKSIPASVSREKAIAKTLSVSETLEKNVPKDLTALRLIEAQCASAYFRAWKSLQLNWKSPSRRPVPDDWRAFGSRTSLANGHKLLNINASHPVNAMLNYAYAVLQGQLQIKTVGDGYDPTIGIMHHGRRGKPAFVFDLMEPMRPTVDRAILGFVQSERLDPADFIIRDDGVCRLNPEMAKFVAYQISNADVCK